MEEFAVRIPVVQQVQFLQRGQKIRCQAEAGVQVLVVVGRDLEELQSAGLAVPRGGHQVIHREGDVFLVRLPLLVQRRQIQHQPHGAVPGGHDLRADQAGGAGHFRERLGLQGQGACVEEDGFVEMLPRLGQVDVVDHRRGSGAGPFQPLPEFTGPGCGAVGGALAQENLGGVRGGEALEHFLVGLALARDRGGLQLLGPGGGNDWRIDVEPQSGDSR